MKALVAALTVLMSFVNFAQALPLNGQSQCSPVVKIDSILYADTKDETVDSVTVCENGSSMAFHSFTAPALGAAPPEPTKWNYTAQIDKNELSDLKQIIGRPDIGQLPESVNAVKTHSPVDVLMRFTILNHGTEKTITLHVPPLECGKIPTIRPSGFRSSDCRSPLSFRC